MQFIIIIILFVLLMKKNKQYKKLLEEIKELRQTLNIDGEITTSSESSLKLDTDDSAINVEMVSQNLVESKEVSQVYKIKQKDKKIRDEQEQKNIAILVSGAICIVLSAIVFLMSTWNEIPNLLKTVVLALLTLVFFGASYIAKEKFKLEKASDTFFYITMAYIPICLVSIAVFELFGHYLSIYGEGKYIYLLFVFLFVTFIYYVIYNKKRSKYLLYGSVLSQLFSVISFSLIFSNNILIIGINLLLYNILLMLITKNKLFVKIYNFIPKIITLLSLFMLFNQDKMMMFLLALLAINYLILELKNTRTIYSYMFNLSLITLGLYTVGLYNELLGINISYLIVLSYVIVLYLIESVILLQSNRKNLINSISVISVITMAFLHVESFNRNVIINPYIVSLLQFLILITIYLKSNSTGKQISALLIPIYFISTGINVLNQFNCSYHFYIFFALFTFIINELVRKRDKLIYMNWFVISHILISITYIIVFASNYDQFKNDVLYALLLIGIYIYCYLIQKTRIFKYFMYITLNLGLFTLFSFFTESSEILYYIPMLSTLIVVGIENSINKLSDAGSEFYLTFSKLISFAAIYSSPFYYNSEISTILTIGFAVLIIIDNIVTRKEMLWNIVPLISAIPALFINDLDTELQIGIMMLAVIATTVISLNEKKISVFTIFSGIYLLLTSFNIDSVYLVHILFILWSVIHFVFITTEKGHNLFKFLSYLSLLFLYNTSIYDLELTNYTLFNMLGYVMIVILTLRTIVIRYVKNIDVLEYVSFGFIYLNAIQQYNSESDGMLFGLLIVAVIILSYVKKYGALFMVSIFALFINVLALTREFWFSLPWWVYLLTIGTLLIGFAIKNEINDKKSSKNAIEFLRNIKDKIEK